MSGVPIQYREFQKRKEKSRRKKQAPARAHGMLGARLAEQTIPIILSRRARHALVVYAIVRLSGLAQARGARGVGHVANSTGI